MKHKTTLLVVGFLLFMLGITSLAMELLGTHWYILAWLERGGRLLAFVVKILMTIGGVLCIVLARTDWEREKKDSSE